MVVHDTYRPGVTVYRYKWFETLEGPGYRAYGPGQRIGRPSAVGEPVHRRPGRRRDLEVILDPDAVTPAMISRWCARSLTRRPMLRLLVSGHALEADRKRALVLQFKHPLDAAAFLIDFKTKVSPEAW